MRQFTVLYTACTDHLPDAELQDLYRDVTAQDDSPECFINTSMIISRTEAKQQSIRPPCDHDTFLICGPMLGAGAKTCEADYCELCPEAHSCDGSCEFPCAPGDTGPGAETGGGHRIFRFLAEIGGWASGIAEYSLACPLDMLESRVQEVDAVCCAGGNGVCVEGLPEACPYRCGRMWTTFFEDCQSVLSRLFDEVDEFEQFTASCLNVDPVSVTMALHQAQCTVCGDGAMTGNEQCDNGSANSDSPSSRCRTNCRLPTQSPVTCEHPRHIDCGAHGVCSCHSDFGRCGCECTDGYTGSSCETGAWEAVCLPGGSSNSECWTQSYTCSRCCDTSFGPVRDYAAIFSDVHALLHLLS